MKSVDDDARVILEYMRLDMDVTAADIIIGHGCLDTRVAERSAQLMLDGFGDLLVFTGGFGKVTKYVNSLPEAETFRNVAVDMGVEREKVMTESESTYTVANVQNTIMLLNKRSIQPKSVIAVTKPYMERRLYATYMKQWPNSDNTKIMVTSPHLSYEQHISKAISKDMFINVMVGDFQRILEFPSRGFQIEQLVPSETLEAYERLLSHGYTKHLIDF